jgi:hypothetical protein
MVEAVVAMAMRDVGLLVVAQGRVGRVLSEVAGDNVEGLTTDILDDLIIAIVVWQEVAE